MIDSQAGGSWHKGFDGSDVSAYQVADRARSSDTRPSDEKDAYRLVRSHHRLEELEYPVGCLHFGCFHFSLCQL
jgi:hypothetical protein